MVNVFLKLVCVSFSSVKVGVFSGKQPRRRITPYISSIIKYQMILCSGRKYVLHRFCLKTSILVPTYNSVSSKAITIFQKSKMRFTPCVNIIRRRLSSKLCSYPSTNTICINSGTFCINIDFK